MSDTKQIHTTRHACQVAGKVNDKDLDAEFVMNSADLMHSRQGTSAVTTSVNSHVGPLLSTPESAQQGNLPKPTASDHEDRRLNINASAGESSPVRVQPQSYEANGLTLNASGAATLTNINKGHHDFEMAHQSLVIQSTFREDDNWSFFGSDVSSHNARVPSSHHADMNRKEVSPIIQ